MLPANGFFIGGILFSAIWTLLSGFFRMAFIYILSMIALILLFAISPLIMPMMLFKFTYNFFEAWWKLVVSMMLQPVILFAFFTFVASMMSTTIYNMQQLFSKLQMQYNVSAVNHTGDNNDIQTVVSAVGDSLGKMDADTILYGITTLITAYLLISFINFVSTMAWELAGATGGPNLGELSSDFMTNRGF